MSSVEGVENEKITFIRLLSKISPGLRAPAVVVEMTQETVNRECHVARIAVVCVSPQREPCIWCNPILGVPRSHSVCNHSMVEVEVEERFRTLVVWDQRSWRELPAIPAVIPSLKVKC